MLATRVTRASRHYLTSCILINILRLDAVIKLSVCCAGMIAQCAQFHGFKSVGAAADDSRRCRIGENHTRADQNVPTCADCKTKHGKKHQDLKLCACECVKYPSEG